MVTVKINSKTRANPGKRLEAANAGPPTALLTDNGTGSDNKTSSQPAALPMNTNGVKNIQLAILFHKVNIFMLTGGKSNAIFMISF
jgi:hypothetical protein